MKQIAYTVIDNGIEGRDKDYILQTLYHHAVRRIILLFTMLKNILVIFQMKLKYSF